MSSSTASSDMSALTASLERSLQNFSLSHHIGADSIGIGGGYGSSSTSTDESSPGRIENLHHRRRGRRVHPCLSSSSSSSSSASASKLTDANTLVELNSHISMPYHWEQCLDLKTGEVYYVNWRTGKKAKEDPRLSATSGNNNNYYNYYYYYSDNTTTTDDSNGESSQDEEEDLESEGSSTEYSSPTSRQSYRPSAVTAGRGGGGSSNKNNSCRPGDVLVVAGCQMCMMYYMVPKHVDHCPKCSGHLLHFDDRSLV